MVVSGRLTEDRVTVRDRGSGVGQIGVADGKVGIGDFLVIARQCKGVGRPNWEL